MARRKKEIVMPHLNDCGGDTKKKWYVEFSIRNPQTDKMERVRHYDGFEQLATCRECYVHAKKLIKEYTRKLQVGKIAHMDFVEYDDLLLYDGQTCFSNKRIAKTHHIRIYLSEFLSKKKAEICSASMSTYTAELRTFYLYLEEMKICDKSVTSYDSDMINDFLRYLAEKKKLSKITIQKYSQILSSFFDFLRKKKVITENPAQNTIHPGVIKDEAPAAIPAYMRKLLQEKIEHSDPQLWMFICFEYYMAIRPGIELRLMRLHQINYGSKTITIYSEKAKNNRTETIDIPDQMLALITEKWKLQTYNQELYVFGRNQIPGNTCLGKNNMKNRFNQFRAELKLPLSVKLYSWKHSGAQELADNNTSIYEIQRHLRHRDMTTTEQYLRKRIGQRSNAIKHHFPDI